MREGGWIVVLAVAAVCDRRLCDEVFVQAAVCDRRYNKESVESAALEFSYPHASIPVLRLGLRP
jgi:hypothetical protein